MFNHICCKGGGLFTDILDIWRTATAGCGGLPSPGEVKILLQESGFFGIQVKNLIPGESFYAFAGYNASVPLGKP